MKVFVISPNYAPEMGAENLVAYKLINKLSEDNLFDVKVVARSFLEKYKKIDISMCKHEIFIVDNNVLYSKNKLLNKALKKINWFRKNLEIFKREGKESQILHTRSTPIESHLVGYIIKKFVKKDIKWIVSFSDPWYKSPYYKKNIITSKLQFIVEEIIIKSCDYLILNNEYQKKFIYDSHPSLNLKKVKIIPHTYDNNYYPKDDNTVREKNNLITITYIGTLDEKRNCNALLESICRRNKELEGKVNFCFYGSMPKKQKDYIKYNKLGSIVKFLGSIDYNESLKVMKDSDILLIIDADLEMDYNPYLPSKIVDYFGAMKPIIAITMKNGATSKVINQTNNYFIDIRIKEEIDELLSNIINDRLVIQPNFNEYKKYNVDRVVENFKNIILE